jgi:hypothetical protein
MADGAIATLVNATLLSAAKRRARFISFAEGSVRFMIDGEWNLESTPPQQLHVPMVRRIGVMIGVLPPRRAEIRFGGVVLETEDNTRAFYRVSITRDEQLSALVEVVTEAELAARTQPQLPSDDPYRSSGE